MWKPELFTISSSRDQSDYFYKTRTNVENMPWKIASKTKLRDWVKCSRLTCLIFILTLGLAQGSSSNTDPGGGKGPPLEIAVKLGSDAILPCDAVDPNQPSDLLEWRKNGSKSPIFIKFMNFKPHIDSRYSRRLHMINSSAILLSGAKESDAGIYRCRTMQSGSESTILTHGRWVVLKVTGKLKLVDPKQ